MPTSNTEELGRFLKCTVIGRGVFGPCACWTGHRIVPRHLNDVGISPIGQSADLLHVG